MTALPQAATPQTIVSQPSQLRDRLLLAGVVFVAPALVIAAICIAALSIH